MRIYDELPRSRRHRGGILLGLCAVVASYWAPPLTWVFMAGFAALLLSRRELRLDYRARRFWTTRGLLPFAHRQAGTFDELKAIDVENRSPRDDGEVTYRVVLEWNVPDREAWTLADCRTPERAFSIAEAEAERLGIPLREDAARRNLKAQIDATVRALGRHA